MIGIAPATSQEQSVRISRMQQVSVAYLRYDFQFMAGISWTFTNRPLKKS